MIKVSEYFVKIVVANSFQEEVHKAHRDVLIVFHAPWCQHCQVIFSLDITKAHASTLFSSSFLVLSLSDLYVLFTLFVVPSKNCLCTNRRMKNHSPLMAVS